MAGRGRRAGREPDGLRLEGYEDLVPVATGGSSTVYRGRQPAYQREVAVKVITAPLRSERERQRFARELGLTGRLTGHPSTVIPLDSGFTADGRAFVTTPWYAGGSLEDRLATGPLPVADVLRYGVRLAGALSSAHSAGIVHRDVKPANVLLSAYGEPALADFGIAVTTDATHRTEAMTAAHAAPEVLENGPAAEPADVWSLGSTLWTLLAGTPPFAALPDEGVLPAMLRVLQQPPPPLVRPDVPPALVALLTRCLAKAPAERPSAAEAGQGLQEVQRALGEQVAELSVSTSAPAPLTGMPEASTTGPRVSSGVLSPGAPVPARDLTSISDQQRLAPVTPQAPARRRPVWLYAATGAVVLLVAVAVTGVLTRGGGTQAAAPTPSATGAAVPPFPTGLRAKVAVPGVTRVTWTDPNAGKVDYVVVAYHHGVALSSTVASATGATVTGLQPGVDYCYVVALVVSFGRNIAGPSVCTGAEVPPSIAPSARG